MRISTISNVMSLLQKPVSELIGYERPKAVSPVSRAIEIAEDTASRMLRREARQQRASQWQGLARAAELRSEGVECSARTESCQDFNGDFYGLRKQEAGKIAFFLGDVSGKGLPAAFYQTSCLTLLQHATRLFPEPTDVVDELNSILVERTGDERFATLLYGVFDNSEQTLTLVSAGHPLPFLLSKDGDVREVDCPLGLPVGLYSESPYQSRTVRVKPGDTLVVYSDGLSEARDLNRDFLGEMGLLGLLIRFSDFPLQQMTSNVMREVNRFAYKRGDDQTIVALRFGAEA